MVLPVAAVLGGASILGGIFSANAASRGARTQADAALEGARIQADTQRDIFGQQREIYEQDRDLALEMSAPFREAGLNALGDYSGQLAGGFEATPGYAFARDEGLKAIQRSQPGMQMSSDTAKAMGRYATGLASQEYGGYMNRLASLAGLGQTATAGTVGTVSGLGQGFSGMGSQYATNVGNAQAAGLNSAAQARAGGMMGVSNAFNGTLNALSGVAGAAEAGLFGNNPWGFKANSSRKPAPFGAQILG